MTNQKIHEAWWRGFNIARDCVFDILDNSDFDFDRCTSFDQICKEVKRVIKTKLKDVTEGKYINDKSS